jgi:hypothetical protein
MGCLNSTPTKDEAPVEKAVKTPTAAAPMEAPAATTKAAEATVAPAPSEPAVATSEPTSAPPAVKVPAALVASIKPKCFVIYYSMYGHVAQMVAAVAKGVAEGGMDATCFQVRRVYLARLQEIRTG